MTTLLAVLGVTVLIFCCYAAPTGPLRVCPDNPRYFADASGRALLLTGSHTWPNLRDMGPDDPPQPFDFGAYLDTLTRYGHNFIRLWAWDLTRYQYSNEPLLHCAPFPWQRTGPELALDGKPCFDLTRFNDAYFDRLRQRVQAAGERGIFVSIMLFEGHGIQCSLPPWCWDGHPFNVRNNVNGINGDPNGDGRGLEVQTLQLPEVLAIQEAYLRRVVDTVSDLDNVLFEITNEAGPYSTEWQFHMIRFLQEYERSKGRSHPVGMTFQYSGGSNRTLFESPADWISPGPEGGYTDNPPPADGSKVILTDTDHLWGIGGSVDWVWKSVCRGLNPIFMDPYTGLFGGQDAEAQWEPIRRNMGYARRLTLRMDLNCAVPLADCASSKYCLANPGQEYLVFVPAGGEVTLNLEGVDAWFAVEWLNPASGQTLSAPAVKAGTQLALRPPFAGSAVLFLSRTN